MDPPVLIRVAADDALEHFVVPLGDFFDPFGLVTHGRVVDAFDAELELHRAAGAPHVEEYQRRAAGHREDADRFVVRGRAVHELDPAPFRAGVLIAQEGQRSVLVEHFFDVRGAALLGQDDLAGRAAELFQVFVQKRIIQRPGNRVRGEAEHTGAVAHHLEVAEVSQQHHHRAAAEGLLDLDVDVLHLDVLMPVGVVQLARCVGDLADHQAQVVPTTAGQFLPLFGRKLGEGVLQVRVDQFAADLQHVACQPGQKFGALGADGKRRCLKRADKQANDQINDVINNKLGPHFASLRCLADMNLWVAGYCEKKPAIREDQSAKDV